LAESNCGTTHTHRTNRGGGKGIGKSSGITFFPFFTKGMSLKKKRREHFKKQFTVKKRVRRQGRGEPVVTLPIVKRGKMGPESI